MTRAGEPELAADPVAAVLRVLQGTAAALDAASIKARLVAGGADAQLVAKAWRRAQPKLRAHGGVQFAGNRYRWTRAAPDDALPAELAQTRAELAQTRAELAQAQAYLDRVRADIARTEPDLAQPGETGARSDELRHAQERQLKIDSARTLAELVMEVEELAANEVEPHVLIHRVRARVRRAGLEPIEQAGTQVAFDRRRHKPIGGGVADGDPVSVVRPGYVWKAPGEDVLIGKAVVEE